MGRFSRIRSGVLVGAIALAAPCVLVACEAITGLSKYEKTQCDGLRCPDDDAGADAELADGDGGQRDGEGAKPVQWARWRMPNYAPSLPPPGIEAGVVDNAGEGYSEVAGGVQDKVTGLVWAMPMPNVGTKNYKDAEKVCVELPGGSWRLPSRIELVTLLDLSKPGVNADAVFTTGAGAITAARYWTSSEVRPFGKGGRLQYWGVDFGGTGVTKLDADQPNAVRCVKGAP